MTLRIKDWDEHYENNRTRGLKQMNWVPLPNSFGDLYTEMMEQKDGPIIYAGWVLLVLTASRCHPRGTLVRGNGRDHNSTTLGRLCRTQKVVFEKATTFCLKIGWLEEIPSKFPENEDNPEIPQEGAENPQEADIEWKGREGNGMEGKDSIVGQVIEFLNQHCGTQYKPSSKKSAKLINARVKEGFDYVAFMNVIQKKTKEWKGTEWEKFLRPETLFGTKFEGYLNQTTTKDKSFQEKVKEAGFA